MTIRELGVNSVYLVKDNAEAHVLRGASDALCVLIMWSWQVVMKVANLGGNKYTGDLELILVFGAQVRVLGMEFADFVIHPAQRPE